METYVIDASVGLKWYFDEAGKESADFLADQLREKKIQLVVPEFFYAECANVLRTKVRRRMIKSADAIKMLDELLQLPLKRYSDWELSDSALEDALQWDLTVYDAMYVALAEIYVAPFVTADEQILKALRNRFDFILPLNEIGSF